MDGVGLEVEDVGCVVYMHFEDFVDRSGLLLHNTVIVIPSTASSG